MYNIQRLQLQKLLKIEEFLTPASESKSASAAVVNSYKFPKKFQKAILAFETKYNIKKKDYTYIVESGGFCGDGSQRHYDREILQKYFDGEEIQSFYQDMQNDTSVRYNGRLEYITQFAVQSSKENEYAKECDATPASRDGEYGYIIQAYYDTVSDDILLIGPIGTGLRDYSSYRDEILTRNFAAYGARFPDFQEPIWLLINQALNAISK